MKTNSIIPVLHLAAVAQQPRLNLQVLLKDAAGRFLKAMAPQVSPESLYLYEYSLRDLVSGYGFSPIRSISSQIIQQALFAPKRRPLTNLRVLVRIKTFFRWARDQGWLPFGPTAADSIQVQVPPPAPGLIIHPDELKVLLGSEAEVELRLAMAFWSFAGLNNLQVNRLRWQQVVPGQTILISPKNRNYFVSATRIAPVLDQWLRPFYRCRGPVVSFQYLRMRCRQHARVLGLRAKPSVLRRSFHAYSRLLRPRRGVKVALFRNRLGGAPTPAQAQEFFSLTPEKVGLTNWPELVAEHLAICQEAPTRCLAQ